MDISIIVPTYNREEVLIKTIESILESCKKLKYKIEVIVIDQTKFHKDSTLSYLQDKVFSGEIRLIKEEKPSLPRARNIGIRASKGKYIIFTDDDVELDNNFIEEHINQYKDNSIGAVVGKVTICNGSKKNILLNNGGKIKNNIKKIIFLNFRDRASVITKKGLVLSDFTKNRLMEADTVIGCNMSFRKEIFDKCGFFDENYIGNAIREESDLCCRVKEKGYKIIYNNRAHLYHIMFNTGGCRNEENKDYWEKYFYNQCYFLVKNFKVSKLRVKLNLIFDIWGCRNYKINAIKIIDEKYEKVCKILKGEI